VHNHRQHPSAQSAAAAGAPRLLAVLGLVLAFLVVEVASGVLTGSLALLADAGHMLTDAAGLAMALLAVWFARRPPTRGKSFGYYRVEILAALANGILLLVVAGLIVAEAIRRFAAPPAVASIPMLAVAAVGLAVNVLSMRLLAAGQARSLNLRAAYLEVLGDLLGSIAVIVAGAVILTTGFRLADPIASIAIAVLILPRTWTLLRDATDILLQATPRDVDVDEVRRHIAGTSGVVGTHDLHAWTLTSGIRVVSAHVVIASGANPAAVLDELERCLCDDFDMEHSTLQLETVDRRRWEHATHA
jgi:cobalt-zinc-cadmium efflux system protein